MFEDTGDERYVIDLCRRCYRTGENLRDVHYPIVSPRGTAHDTHDGFNGETACGIDATEDGWWHRL